ncbi:acyl-CoA transferase, partial [Pseudomonas sp. TNT11]|nr:acyl-CoA transferase [Pseudomonas emilianonis]
RLASGRGGSARLSLARTAKLLVDAGPVPEQPPLRAEAPEDQGLVEEQTAWGPAHRLLAPIAISGTPLQWDLPAGELGSHRPQW